MTFKNKGVNLINTPAVKSNYKNHIIDLNHDSSTLTAAKTSFGKGKKTLPISNAITMNIMMDGQLSSNMTPLG